MWLFCLKAEDPPKLAPARINDASLPLTYAFQLITYTGQTLFEKYKVDFTNLLNGLEIKD